MFTSISRLSNFPLGYSDWRDAGVRFGDSVKKWLCVVEKYMVERMKKKRISIGLVKSMSLCFALLAGYVKFGP